MTALQRKAFRTIWENKTQFLGALIMVFISSMMIVGMTTVSGNLEYIFNSFSTNNALGDAEFSTNSDVDIENLEHRFDAIIEKSSVVDYELMPGQTLRIFSENSKLNIHTVIEGNNLGGNSILIDPLFAAANGLSLGDTLMIEGERFEISGNMVIPNYIYIIRSKDELINDPMAFGIAVLSRQNLDKLAGKTHSYAIRFHARENIHEQELSFKAYLLTNGVDITSWESTENNARVSYIALEVQTLSTMSKAVPGLLLSLSVILIGILLNRMIQRESAVIGTLYALGYRKTELLRHYLLYPLLIAAAGGGLGALLGLVIVKPMLDFFTITVFPMPVAAYQYNYGLLIVGVLTPVIVLCLTSCIVIIWLLRASPAELMKGIRVSEKLNVVERALKLEQLNFTTKFQVREQVRSLSRTGFLLFGIIVATMLLLYGLTLQNSLNYMLNEGIGALYNLKFEYVFKELQSDAPASGTEQWNGIYVTPQHDRKSNFAIIGVLPETSRIRLKDQSGSPLIPDKVIITNILAEKLKVGQGDELHVISDTDLKEYTLTIDAVADSAVGEFIFMPFEKMNEMLGVPAGSYIGIWTDEPITFPEGVLSSTKSMDAVAAGIRNLINQSGIVVYSLMISAFVLGLIIIFIVTGMIIEENRITISLFKVLGYRPKEVNKLILESNTAIVIVGYFIGIPIILASVTVFMQSLASSMQMTIPARLSIWSVLFGFVVVMLTYGISNLLSRRKIDRVPMSEALKAGTE